MKVLTSWNGSGARQLFTDKKTKTRQILLNNKLFTIKTCCFDSAPSNQAGLLRLSLNTSNIFHISEFSDEISCKHGNHVLLVFGSDQITSSWCCRCRCMIDNNVNLRLRHTHVRSKGLKGYYNFQDGERMDYMCRNCFCFRADILDTFR